MGYVVKALHCNRVPKSRCFFVYPKKKGARKPVRIDNGQMEEIKALKVQAIQASGELKELPDIIDGVIEKGIDAVKQEIAEKPQG